MQIDKQSIEQNFVDGSIVRYLIDSHAGRGGVQQSHIL